MLKQMAHQIKNAGQAIALLRSQDVFNVPEAAMKAGLDWARWPGRMQDISDSSITKPLPQGSQVWLDGGHNPGAAAARRANAAEQKAAATNLASGFVLMSHFPDVLRSSR